MDTVGGAPVGDEWGQHHVPHSAAPNGLPHSSAVNIGVRRRHDDPIDSMLTTPLFANPGAAHHSQHTQIPSMSQMGGEVHHALAMSMQRRLPHPQPAQPHYAQHAPRLPQPHLGVSQPPPLPQPLPVHRAPSAHPVKREKSPIPCAPLRAPRPTAALFTAPPDSLSPAERRRIRGALLAQKRARRWGSAAPGTPMDSELLRVVKTRLCKNADGANAAASALDKKTARVIRNREVALRARQKAKAKMHHLESENTNLKTKASNLERENSNLKMQIENLKESLSRVDIASAHRDSNWSGDVTLDAVIAP